MDETRAEIARRRLARLAESFDAQWSEEAETAAGAGTGTGDGSASGRRWQVRGTHVRVLVVVGCAAAVLLGWWLLAGRPQDVGLVPGTADEVPAAAASPAPAAEVIVDVVGKVERPGIVVLPAGSRVHEAIEAAGGLAGEVDRETLNLARPLTDGEQLLVGIEPAVTSSGPGGAGGAGPTGKVDLNTADLAALDALPGVGPVTAQAILDWREKNGRFAAVDDLLDVRGIGEATLAELRDLVAV